MKSHLLPILASALLLASAGPARAQVHPHAADFGRACATPEPDPVAAGALQAAVNAWLKQSHTEAAGQIKVAFHVIYDPRTGEGNVPDSQIADQIKTLNRDYASDGFSFVLASTSRTGEKKWFAMTPGGREKNMKAALAVNPAHRLNVYTCRPGQNFLGWAYFPDSFPENSIMHGVVIHYGSLPGGNISAYDEGKTLTHEVGHYLGLYHTFEGGCVPPGDYIDDTPFEASPYTGGECDLERDTCPSPGLDPISNYMDYSFDACLTNFSAGQKARMQAITSQYRPSLLNAGARAMDLALVSPAVVGVSGEVSFAGALPNPSHGGTTLEYALPRAATVSLQLYSVSGRRLATIDSGPKEAGAHRVSLASNGLTAGTYFAVLTVEGRKLSRTVILE